MKWAIVICISLLLLPIYYPIADHVVFDSDNDMTSVFDFKITWWVWSGGLLLNCILIRLFFERLTRQENSK